MQYRPEIDGLRAVAIIPVVLYHLDVALFEGGFIGVDIFFVISGFLVTSIIVKGVEDESFSLTDFYRRRALRILPPLFVVMIATVLGAYLYMLPNETKALGESIIAATFFVSNVYFNALTDYFNPTFEANPLLHTWSLAVEEQFYIVVPLLLMAVHKLRWSMRTWLVGAVVIVSFGLSVAMVGSRPAVTFYQLPTRFWEMGVGAVLALAGARAVLTGAWAKVGAIVGLAMIGYSLFTLTGTSAFPAHNALAPVVGTALLIASGDRSQVGSLLSTRPLTFVGKISYSLYLWHWPLITFQKLRGGPQLSPSQMVMLAAISTVLATISYRFVEQPFRHLRAPSTRRVLGAASAGMALLAVAAFVVTLSAGAWRGYPDEVLRLAEYDGYTESDEYFEQYRAGSCFLNSSAAGGFAAFEQDTCLGNGEGTLLVGDSHAAQLAGPLSHALEGSLHQATASGCKPVIQARGQARCTELMSFVYEEWIDSHAPARALIGARWQLEDVEPLLRTITHLKERGVEEIVVLGPTVEYESSVPPLLARDALNGTSSTATFRDQGREELDLMLEEMVRETGAHYISIHDLVCPEGGCRLRASGEPFHFDYGHFTQSGATVIASEIVGILDSFDLAS